jgi:accessory gene regulator protein AgrB
MSIDRTKDKERFAQMIKSWIDQFAHTISSTDTKNHIQMLIIEPFMQYILQRAFPYMIIAICLFAGIFLFVILTFVLLLLNRNKINVCPFCDKSI